MGVCDKPGSPACIVTEMLNGNLLQLAHDGFIEIDTNRVVSIIADVATGMAHLHVRDGPINQP